MQGTCQIKLDINLILSSIVQVHHIHGVKLHEDYSSQTRTPSFPEDTCDLSAKKVKLNGSRKVDKNGATKNI
jgi:hypothetical protein